MQQSGTAAARAPPPDQVAQRLAAGRVARLHRERIERPEAFLGEPQHAAAAEPSQRSKTNEERRRPDAEQRGRHLVGELVNPDRRDDRRDAQHQARHDDQRDPGGQQFRDADFRQQAAGERRASTCSWCWRRHPRCRRGEGPGECPSEGRCPASNQAPDTGPGRPRGWPDSARTKTVSLPPDEGAIIAPSATGRGNRHALGSHYHRRAVRSRHLAFRAAESRGRDHVVSRLQRPGAARPAGGHLLRARHGDGRQPVVAAAAKHRGLEAHELRCRSATASPGRSAPRRPARRNSSRRSGFAG